MIYKPSKYIFPPRPENCFPRTGMDTFDNGVYMAQPKFNGKCTEVYYGEDIWKIYNRHRDLTEFKITKDEMGGLIGHLPGTHLIVGEYMNTSKKNELGKVFNNKFMIFDILVISNDHLIGATFQERMDLLVELFRNKISEENDYSFKLTDNIFLTKTFYKGFGELWDKFVTIDMLEGLVLKRKDAGLEPGVTEKNNTKSQLKCRKPTKNYTH